jgi:hypothetical protein
MAAGQAPPSRTGDPIRIVILKRAERVAKDLSSEEVGMPVRDLLLVF